MKSKTLEIYGKLIRRRKSKHPNMPKYLFCPECSYISKRTDKTVGGSNYKCPKHGEFFVRKYSG